MSEQQYLGDGVYALIERGDLILRTGAHDRTDGQIVLEPEVWRALEAFVLNYRRSQGSSL